jgi:hypothetical protein
MALAIFMKWATQHEHRVPVSVNPTYVKAVEFGYAPQKVRAVAWTDDTIKYSFDDFIEAPACTKILMNGKDQEYWVQGTVEDITAAINAAKKESK